MEALDGVDGLCHKAGDLGLVEAHPAAKKIGKGAAGAALQEEIDVCAVLKGAQEADDVRVFEALVDGNLGLELLPGSRLLQGLLADDLSGHHHPIAHVLQLVYGSEAALAQHATPQVHDGLHVLARQSSRGDLRHHIRHLHIDPLGARALLLRWGSCRHFDCTKVMLSQACRGPASGSHLAERIIVRGRRRSSTAGAAGTASDQRQ
mmetsp:Transcript_12033/g.33842  ORF Transcript_12033/g.33842 Transcript_12033/m.33842 type:complete len:206 (+) Transcript_12033:2826-3443(+)